MTTATMRVFYSNAPAYEIGVPTRFWVDDLGRVERPEDIVEDDEGAWHVGPFNYRFHLDGGWQTLRPEETQRCSGCHNAHVATTLTPGTLRYCAVCTIKWNPCRVCGQTRLHGLHTTEEWEALR